MTGQPRFSQYYGLCRITALILGINLTMFCLPAFSGISQIPLYLTQSADARVELLLSRDNQLYFKAYTDYTDLDGDGILDTTYNDKFSYYGYFDSSRCYDYTSNSRFEPSANHVTGYDSTNPTAQITNHQCSLQWSGNFLNWATMTRIDVLRKALYGGYRSQDDASTGSANWGTTVLERTLIPHDAHAFVKVYSPTSTDPAINTLTPYSSATAISLCNVTYSTDAGTTTAGTAANGVLTSALDITNYPPKLRVANGSWKRWSSGEIYECVWNEEKSESSSPRPTNSDRLNPSELVVRVRVCKDDNTKETNCETYTDPNTNYNTLKPAGLLQQYSEKTNADTVPVRFGLFTGSYLKNKSGGILRRKIENLVNNATSTKNEIDQNNGKFINQSVTTPGIIYTLNQMRIGGFKLGDANGYSNGAPTGGSSCGLITSFTDAQCVDWGNPMSEIYAEALLYLSGKTATSAFDADESNLGTQLKLPKDSWSDPIPSSEWCAKPSIIAISTGLNSFDGDGIPSSLNKTANDSTDSVGSIEGISGSYMIGKGSSTASDDDILCTSKTITKLSDARGICPQEPFMQGTYKIAGLAYYAHTNALRTGTNYQNAPKVDTYALALADSLPSFAIRIGTNTITFLPLAASNSTAGAKIGDTGWMASGMTELIVENWHTNNGNPDYGSLLIYWSDLPWGNDYDMDGVERIQFCVGSACSTYNICNTGQYSNPPSSPPNKPTSTTACPTVANDEMLIRVIPAQAAAGYALRFGFTISGTGSTDGAYNVILRPGGNNFTYIGDPTSTGGGGTFTSIHSGVDKPLVMKFKASSSGSAKLLNDPLWYAAKFGGYTEKDGTTGPTRADEWVTPDDNGTIPTSTAKQVPNKYFKVRNPNTLEDQLEKAFKDIIISARISSSSSVAANSVRLDTGTMIYQGRFSSYDWSGQLLAYPVNVTTGAIGTQSWDASTLIPAANQRQIFTYDPSAATGESFQWLTTTGGLSDAKKIALLSQTTIPPTTAIPTNTSDLATFNQNGTDLTNYLRGDSSNELNTAGTSGKFRRRASKLGDIVNSDPAYVGSVNFQYNKLPSTEPESSSYLSYLETIQNRSPMIYVGANDGMLHGFDATTGVERFAYVPNLIIPDLYLLADRNYAVTNTTTSTSKTEHRYFVDGPSWAGDAYVKVGSESTAHWHTILVGSTGAGGHTADDGTERQGGAIFAMDVTDPLAFDKTKIMWEFSWLNDDDMGYPIGQPLIVRMHNGKWAAIFGNGYYSKNQKAVLYIVDLETGGLIKKLDTLAGPITSSGLTLSNGLSTPTPVDLDGDRITDLIYAGDLLGNIWKFDVHSTNASNWDIAYHDTTTGHPPLPLFTAKDSSGNRQPITAAPELTKYLGSPMLFIGTGKFFESDDNKISTVSTDPYYPKIQTLYGIRDLNTGANTDIVNSDRSTLQQQTIVYQGAFGTSTTNVRVISSNSVASTKQGWYLDLIYNNTREGERSVSNPLLHNNRIIFTTLVPSQAVCVFGGYSWVMEMDVSTGGNLGSSVFDLNNDNKFDAGDQVVVSGSSKVVSAIQTSTSEGIIKTPDIIGAGNYEYKYGSGSALGNVIVIKEKGGGSGGRQSWRQIPEIK